MKITIQKISILFFLFLHSFAAYTQVNKIDSLRGVLQTQKEDTNKVNTLNLLSLNFLEINDSLNAMQYAMNALSLSEKVYFKKGEGQAYYNIGSVYHTYRKLEYALKNYLIALKLQKEVGDKTGSADSYISIAIIYMTKENDPEALNQFYEGLKIYEETGDKKSAAYSLQMIGTIHCNQSNDSEGLKNYLASLKFYIEMGDKSGIALSHGNIGSVYFREGKYEKSLQEHFTALEMYKGQEEWVPNWGVSFCYRNIGTVYEKQGELMLQAGDKKFAVKKFTDALNIYLAESKIEEKNYNGGIGDTYGKIGNIYIKLQNLPAAKYYLEKGMQLSQSYKSGLRDIYKSFSILDSIQGNYIKAYEHYKMYILFRDKLINEESSKKIVQIRMQYEFGKKETVAKMEQEKKDAEAQRIKNKQYLVIASLGIIIVAVLIIAFILFRNNKQKQKANILITEQKQKVESTLTELKTTQTQLIQSAKMASLGELTAGIAHEIQNPLNFVNNFSEVNKELLAEMNDEIEKGNLDEVKAIAKDITDNEEKINHHGKRADAIVKGMLQHSQSSSGVKEPTKINKLADEYLRLAYHGLRAKDKSFNATLKTDFDETLEKVNIIPQDIGRVMLNLINNAFYAVAEKKNQIGDGYEPTVSVSTKRVGDKVEISVADNGNGIPQKILDKIFQPFFTTKPTGQGTGLGLSLSYDIIKAHSGEIKVETKEGEGTAFIISLSLKDKF